MRLKRGIGMLQFWIWIAIVCGASASGQQQPRIFSYEVHSIPAEITVSRGTVFEIHGALSPRAPTTTFGIKRGQELVAIGHYRDNWSLTWNTARETDRSCRISVWILNNSGADVLLARAHVQVIDTPPFRIRVTSDRGMVSGMTPIKIAASGASDATRVALTLDEDPLNLPLDAANEGIWDAGRASVGIHVLGGNVYLKDGSFFSLDPVRVRVVPKLQALPLPVGSILDLNTVNGDIALRARLDVDLHPRSVAYLVDDRPIAARDAPPFDSAVWNPAALSRGEHRFAVAMTDSEGKRVVSEALLFTVTPRDAGSAVSTEKPRERYRLSDAGAGVSSPLSFSVDAVPPHVSFTADTRFDVTGKIINNNNGIDFWEVTIQSDADIQDSFHFNNDFRISIKPGKLSPGPHRILVRVRLPDKTARTAAQTEAMVYAGCPVGLDPAVEAIDPFQPALLGIKVDPAFRARSVTYYADGRALPNDPENPLTAVWDPRSELPGVVQIRALVTEADGSQFRTPAASVTIPTRVAVASAPELTLPAAGRTVPLTARLAPGLRPMLALYRLDGKEIGRRASAPFDTVHADARQITRGKHALVIEVVDASGARYDSEPITLTVTDRRKIAAPKKAPSKGRAIRHG